MKRILLAIVFLFSMVLLSCGSGGGGGGQNKQDITVTMSPKTATVSGGTTQQFTAIILNPNNTGVTWTLAGSGCTGSTCGTLGSAGGNNNQGWTIVYTAPLTVPSPATVTLTAISRDDATKSDTATITVTAPVVAVTVSPSAPTVQLGATQQFTATVTGAANTAVTWSAVGPGTISATGLYTAPATLHTPDTVTVTATSQADNTKSASATVNIPAVTLSLSPEISRLVLGATQQFAANVTNATNAGVTWTLTGPGTLNNSGLYTAPSTLDAQTMATVTARSQADSDVFRFISFPIIVTPTISPRNVTVPAGATQQFTADMPVTWTVGGVAGTDPVTWGTISADGVYTAPLTPPWTGKVNITATVSIDSRHSANAVATVVFSNASLQGHYALRYRGNDGSANLFGVASLAADGNGAITSGSMTFNRVGTAAVSVPVTGTYALKPDGRGSATLNFQQGSQSVQFPIHFVLTSNAGGRVVGFDDTGTGWGNIDLQTGLTSPPEFSGTYVFTLDGFDAGLSPIAIAGMFTADGGTISSGVADINDGGSIAQNVPFSGSHTPLTLYQPSTATISLGAEPVHFTFYQLSPDAIIFVAADADIGYLGVAVRREPGATFSNQSLSGNVVFESTGYVAYDHLATVALGRFTADGFGNLTNGVVDDVWSAATMASSTVRPNMAATGTYGIQPDGRGGMTISFGGDLNSFAVYMIGPNNLVYVRLYPGSYAATGQFMPQASGAYDLSTIRGSWALNLRETLFYWPGRTDVIAQISSDGAGNLTGTADVNAIIPDSAARSLLLDSPLTGTYTMEANGRGEATLNINGVAARYAVYAASGRTLFLLPIVTTRWATLGIAARQF